MCVGQKEGGRRSATRNPIIVHHTTTDTPARDSSSSTSSGAAAPARQPPSVVEPRSPCSEQAPTAPPTSQASASSTAATYGNVFFPTLPSSSSAPATTAATSSPVLPPLPTVPRVPHAAGGRRRLHRGALDTRAVPTMPSASTRPLSPTEPSTVLYTRGTDAPLHPPHAGPLTASNTTSSSRQCSGKSRDHRPTAPPGTAAQPTPGASAADSHTSPREMNQAHSIASPRALAPAGAPPAVGLGDPAPSTLADAYSAALRAVQTPSSREDTRLPTYN